MGCDLPDVIPSGDVWRAAPSVSDRNLPGKLKLSAGGGGLEMNQLIYLVGLIVVILAILSFFGLR
jgi:hypothetical protein